MFTTCPPKLLIPLTISEDLYQWLLHIGLVRNLGLGQSMSGVSDKVEYNPVEVEFKISIISKYL